MLKDMTTPVVRIRCSDCPIRHRAVCSTCDTGELEELDRIKFYKTYEAGQTVALRGEELSLVATVVSGTATLTRTMEDGRTQMVGLLLPSDFIGRPGRAVIQFDVTAVSEVTLCCFRRKAFEDMVAKNHHLSERLLQMSLDELDAAREWMLLLGRKTAREKIASLLALIVRRSQTADAPGHGPVRRIDLPISREAIANYLGLTIETVSRQISTLKSDGVIATEGSRGITIPDVGALLAETGDDDEGAVIV